MKAVVLAAGRGKRLHPLTATRPKPLVPISGKPLVKHVLETAAPYIDAFIVIIGYRGDQVRKTIGGHFAGKNIKYVEQAEQRGTAHAVAQAREELNDRFLVLNGDVVFDESLVAALADTNGNAIATMSVENPSNYGVVSVENDELAALVEKPEAPPSHLANLGLYAFETSIFGAIDGVEESERGEYEITDAVESLRRDGEVVSIVEHDGEWLDVGRPWEVLTANERLLSGIETRIEGDVEDGATINGPVIIEADARVRDGVYLEGPVVVKSGADVGPNAYVRGSTVLGEGARVGNAVEVKNSVLFPGATVGHLSYVGDSVLGANVNLGAGTQVANLRHDEENIFVRVKGEAIDTGRRKFGVVCGDGVKTGINTSLNAGVKLDAEYWTEPGEVVSNGSESNT
jgi:bifunctional UDP-N-acetylglucosamine pyrophosphorylase/glucosamine-1-phosphate N-acetyltransferase